MFSHWRQHRPPPGDEDGVSKALSGIASLLANLAEKNKTQNDTVPNGAGQTAADKKSPQPVGAKPPMWDANTSRLRQRIRTILTEWSAEGTDFGAIDTMPLPADHAALDFVLADPPPVNDFAALDNLFACFPRGTEKSQSLALLATCHNLSRNFGLPGRLPMSMSKAWRMLDPQTFENEIAQRLRAVGTFIADWQKTQTNFLILEFGEIEMIEWLFEALHPGYHADLLTGVMNFKVLSNRRLGLVRRILPRVRSQVTPMMPARKEEALVILAHHKALLERIADPSGFAPIVETAGRILEEVEKLMKQTAAAGAPPGGGQPGGGGPPAGGQPLGRIG